MIYRLIERLFTLRHSYMLLCANAHYGNKLINPYICFHLMLYLCHFYIIMLYIFILYYMWYVCVCVCVCVLRVVVSRERQSGPLGPSLKIPGLGKGKKLHRGGGGNYLVGKFTRLGVRPPPQSFPPCWCCQGASNILRN